MKTTQGDSKLQQETKLTLWQTMLLSNYHLLCFHNFVLAREATASPALRLLLLFNFRCITFHLVAGTHIARRASFIENGPQSYIGIYTKCAVNDKKRLVLWIFCNIRLRVAFIRIVLLNSWL